MKKQGLSIKYGVQELVLQRSKKYSTYSDDQLIEMYSQDSLKGQDRHFLYVELEFRNLNEKAEQKKALYEKSRPKNTKLIILSILIVAAFSIRFFKKLL